MPAVESRRASGMIPGAVAVSHGALLYKADEEAPPEWRDPQLQDRSRPIVTQCDLGPLSAISAKTLPDMGFTNVSYLDGGIDALGQGDLAGRESSGKIAGRDGRAAIASDGCARGGSRAPSRTSVNCVA